MAVPGLLWDFKLRDFRDGALLFCLFDDAWRPGPIPLLPILHPLMLFVFAYHFGVLQSVLQQRQGRHHRRDERGWLVFFGGEGPLDAAPLAVSAYRVHGGVSHVVIH